MAIAEIDEQTREVGAALRLGACNFQHSLLHLPLQMPPAQRPLKAHALQECMPI